MALTGKLFYSYLSTFSPQLRLPAGISFINPYPDPEVKRVLKKFTGKYYNDSGKRILILGINPGRFGAGITGVPFTDPVALEKKCGITNSFDKRVELSSSFVYQVIDSYGGSELFYQKFLISSVFPLGLLKGSVNHNYYDSSTLLQKVSPFILESLSAHLKMNVNNDLIIVLGRKNAGVLRRLMDVSGIGTAMEVLDHPRYIMQYKLKSKDMYSDRYLDILRRLSNG